MTELALIGKKIGMTREFYKTGQIVPVTVLKVEKARVIEVIEDGLLEQIHRLSSTLLIQLFAV